MKVTASLGTSFKASLMQVKLRKAVSALPTCSDGPGMKDGHPDPALGPWGTAQAFPRLPVRGKEISSGGSKTDAHNDPQSHSDIWAR